jgi:hypothetical protein
LLLKHLFKLFLLEHLQQRQSQALIASTPRTENVVGTYPARIQRTWLSQSWIRLACKQRLDDVSLVLEHGACERRLAAVIEAVGVGAVVEEQFDEGSVAVVGRQHYLVFRR